ncbi:MAG: hypothetical protein ACRD1O_00860 [Terriglobia bacterium]
MSADVQRYASELRADPALAERILREFPPVPEPERVLIRTDEVSVDAAIVRALALAVNGVESRIELTNP